MTAEPLARADRASLPPAADAAPPPGLRQAYQALAARDLARAVTIARDLTASHPGNVHPWLILGMAALDRLEGATARAFFERARELAPANPEALSGLGKALVLQADPFAAVGLFEAAMAAGSTDLSMIRLYKDLMCRMERQTAAAEAMEGVASRMREAGLFVIIGELYLDAEEFAKALRAFDAACAIDPQALASRMSQVKARLFRQDFAGVAALTQELLAAHPELDEMIPLRMSALRNLGRCDEALALLDAPFQSPISYKRALGVSAHVHLDRGDTRAAGRAFRDALHLTDADGTWAAKAYGTHCFAEGAHAEGAEAYAGRQPASNRARIPYEASAPGNLTGRRRLYVVEEQGIGDQMALLPLVALAPLAPAEREITFVGEARMEAVLAGNGLGIGFRDEDRFDPAAEGVTRSEVVFLGDLARYLPARAPGTGFGGYLRADPARVAGLRARYLAQAGGGPVVGLAWRSSDRLTGYQRSVALSDLVGQLPAGTLAVSLQYGDCAAEIAAAAAAHPQLRLLADPEVDQLADLGGFLAQIAALDRIVTIDNTTAHACGALGHPDAHVLLPAGAECMWYWQRHGSPDPWYGTLHLHRQAAPRDWSRPLAEIAALPPVGRPVTGPGPDPRP